MLGLKAIMTTIGIVSAALGIALIALIIVWLVGNYNYNVDRLLAVGSAFITTAGFVFVVAMEIRRRR